MVIRGLAWIFALSGALATAGCFSNNGHKPDASVDGITYDLSLDLPPGCPPGQANDKGVGAPCTRNGHECGSSLLCTCDTNLGLTWNGLPCMCTKAGLNSQVNNPDPCSTVPANLCGTDATCCNYGSQAYYCSPNICLPGGQCLVFVTDGG